MTSLQTPLVELRWVTFGRNRQLEHRFRSIRVNNWGDLIGIGEWSDWKIVETIEGEDAAWEDVRASGGIARAP
jgi:hypothetical protein